MRLHASDLKRLTAERIAQITNPVDLRIATTWQRERRKHGHGFVYIVRATANEDVKIGWTRNVPARMRELAATNSRPLVLLCVLEAGAIGEDLERALVLRFATCRIKGEWFAPDAALQGWLEILLARAGARFGVVYA